jgi:arylsulfatase A-like enzyme
MSDYARGLLLVIVGLMVHFGSLRAEPAPSTKRPPNIVYILADDLGYGDLGCYGGKIPTPHVDRLAREGLLCTDAHSGSSVCSPTRYGILTGRYAWRTTWMKSGVLAGFDPALIEKGRLTAPELLRRHGYVTACIGKWHLGFGWHWPNAKDRPPLSVSFSERNNWDRLHYPTLTGPIGEGPRTRGFDYFFGQTAPNQDPFCFLENDRIVGLPPEPPAKEFSRINKPVALRDDAILPTLAARAVDYVAQQAKKDRPFFLYLPLTSPHSPVAPSAKYKGKSGIGPVADFLMETDGVVGDVLAALDRHRLAESTLVIFTSDNGHIATEPALQKAGHLPNGPLRGVKGGIYEGGHRVPFVVRWPGVTRAGSVSDEPMCHTHLLATCADLLGIALPADAGEDSFSILPILRNEKLTGPTHPVIVHQSVAGELAIRKGPWKWIEGKELFHLGNDLAESRDLAKENPLVVQELRTRLNKIRSDGRSRSNQ